MTLKIAALVVLSCAIVVRRFSPSPKLVPTAELRSGCLLPKQERLRLLT
jgi:hypothetical protein